MATAMEVASGYGKSLVFDDTVFLSSMIIEEGSQLYSSSNWDNLLLEVYNLSKKFTGIECELRLNQFYINA